MSPYGIFPGPFCIVELFSSRRRFNWHFSRPFCVILIAAQKWASKIKNAQKWTKMDENFQMLKNGQYICMYNI
jgi:hypothetical protein